MASPWPITCIVGGYIFFVTGFGQRLMKDRKAYDLTTIINIYNIIQVFLNLFMGLGVSVICKCSYLIASDFCYCRRF